MIDSSPTLMSTVLLILQKAVHIADELHLDDIVVVFDQAIYAKAKAIRWQDEVFKKRLILRMGDFHTSLAFLAMLYIYIYIYININVHFRQREITPARMLINIE